MTAAILVTIALPVSAPQVRAQNRNHRHISPARQSAVDLLNAGLRGSPMYGTGRALEASGHKWHVSPFFIAAIAATESSLGRAPCRNDRFNSFGLASCGTAWPVPTFRSWAGVYDFMGRYLTGHIPWITSGWPHARTTYDVRGYARCDSCWSAKTAYWMRRLFSSSADVRYAT